MSTGQNEQLGKCCLDCALHKFGSAQHWISKLERRDKAIPSIGVSGSSSGFC
ncbi:MAG: hypothetical protein H6562_04250 [Lewinellaceae bacterium]|nr:hypothetical protein [Lewinella sp.]MCB9278098.1 hypothetical protein [Lewinellaceae bacterium]